MEKPKMSIGGVKYRLETMEHSVNMNRAYPEAGYKEAIEHDKQAIMKGFKDRDTYIEYLECELAKERERRS